MDNYSRFKPGYKGANLWHGFKQDGEPGVVDFYNGHVLNKLSGTQTKGKWSVYYVNPEFLHRYMLRKPGREPVLPEHERWRDLAAYPNSVIVEFDHQANYIDYVLHFPSDTAQRNMHRQLLDKVLHGKFHQFQRPYAVLLW